MADHLNNGYLEKCDIEIEPRLASAGHQYVSTSSSPSSRGSPDGWIRTQTKLPIVDNDHGPGAAATVGTAEDEEDTDSG